MAYHLSGRVEEKHEYPKLRVGVPFQVRTVHLPNRSVTRNRAARFLNKFHWLASSVKQYEHQENCS
jgi:hypothetical protein